MGKQMHHEYRQGQRYRSNGGQLPPGEYTIVQCPKSPCDPNDQVHLHGPVRGAHPICRFASLGLVLLDGEA